MLIMVQIQIQTTCALLWHPVDLAVPPFLEGCLSVSYCLSGLGNILL